MKPRNYVRESKNLLGAFLATCQAVLLERGRQTPEEK